MVSGNWKVAGLVAFCLVALFVYSGYFAQDVGLPVDGWGLVVTTTPAPVPAQGASKILEEKEFGQPLQALPERPSTVPEPLPEVEDAYCGDGVCGVTEDCASCSSDCGCAEGDYCSPAAVCRNKQACGDSVCTPFEKESCCTDCGCIEGVCKPSTQECVEPMKTTSKFVEGVVSKYVSEAGFDLKAYHVADDFYGSEPVKIVALDCSSSDGTVCSVMLVVSADGRILEERYAK